jgi:ubiquinone/menaquinone biosynthesis C-methylase UbiE
VLEIGCGRGDFALWTARAFPGGEITAVDLSAVAIARAQERSAMMATPVEFEVGDGEALRFEDATFDVVISCECLEHVPHPERMTAEIFRVLVPGGRFIVTTENYFNGMLLMWLKSWLTKQPFESGSGVQPHENFFVFWMVRRLFERSGLVIDHMESSHFQWLMLPKTNPTKLCTNDFASPFLKKLFRPFGRHFTFCGHRPR